MCCVCLYFILVFSYVYSLNVGYYFSIIRTDIHESNIVFGALFVAGISTLISPTDISPRNFSYFLFVLMLYIPTIVISALSSDNDGLMLLVLMSALIIGVKSGLPDFRIRLVRLKISLFEVLVFINILLIVSILIQYRSILDIPSFSEVYSLRHKARGLTTYTFGVLLSWAKFVFAPLGFLLGVFYKKKFLLFSSLGVYFSLYVSTGAKSAVIYPVLLFFISYLFQNAHPFKLKLFMASGLVFLVSLFMFLEIQFGYVVYPYTVERAFIAPGVLSNLYFSFFSEGDKAFLGYSVFSSFIDYSYDLEPAFLIGREYFTPETRANASFFADGFANFGLVGVVIFSFLVRLFIFLYTTISFNWSKAVSSTFFIPYALYLINASPLTMLITGGFFVVLLLGLFFEVD